MDEDAFLKNIKDEYNISKKNDKDKLNINNFKIRKQFDDFFGDIDVNKFFEIFNKLQKATVSKFLTCSGITDKS